jgi:hypothetical protein
MPFNITFRMVTPVAGNPLTVKFDGYGVAVPPTGIEIGAGLVNPKGGTGKLCTVTW